MKSAPCVLAALVFGIFCAPVHGEVKLPAVISDHMVLQSGATTTLWGWADAGEEVTVFFGGQSRSTRVSAEGKWKLTLENLAPSREPRKLIVRGLNTLTVDDVLVGEVWLASGQSNMEMQLKGRHGEVDHADEEIAAAKYPQIRFFSHNQRYDIYTLTAPPSQPMEDRPGVWRVCSPETVTNFSSLAFFFARELHQKLDAPIGILSAAVGGTPIEAWTSLRAQEADSRLRPVLDDWSKRLTDYDPELLLKQFNEAKKRWLKERAAARAAGKEAPKAPAPFKNLRVMAPGGLFNALISPLAPYTMRGVIWYQGERNAEGPLSCYYGAQLVTLIHDWRTRWNTGADDGIYFAFVQLPRFKKEQLEPSEANGWGVTIRDEMRKTLSIPHTAMAITIDLGGVTQGHPTNKADYASRLSLLALHDVYGKPVEQWTGPLFRAARREGSKMVLDFDHAKGLKPAGAELTGFAVAGADRKFVWANAKIVGDEVMVWSNAVTEPVAVRYGWASNPKCNLINAAGLPASPFRTDDWPAESKTKNRQTP